MFKFRLIKWIAAASSVLFILGCGEQKNGTPASYPVVKSGDVVVVESGQLKSQNNSFIKAPGSWRMEYQIARLAKEGRFVQAGDTVVCFNTAKTRSLMDEALSELELQQEKYDETV